ncbi:MAG: SulP family inorganic anion transporter [Elusimicrobiota bacterium]
MTDQKDSAGAYRWFVLGDINGFFGLISDNLTILSFLAGILIYAFKFPADIVYGKMFPGTALGVLFGDLAYTWMALRLAKKTKNPSVTAMPLGLDAPSTIGLALAVLGPCFIAMKQNGIPEHEAAIMTWHVGMAVMIFIGVFKVVFSFLGGWVQKSVPQAGLLGSLAGIGLALIGFIPLLDIFGMPLVGLISLGIIIYALIAGLKLPGRFPGVLCAVGVGTILYYSLGHAGASGLHAAAAGLGFSPPVPTLGFIDGLKPALRYLPIAIPFGLLTVVGGINVTESARVAGDDFNTRDILLTEAVATLVAGICGGVAQSTPYIGQPAYKQMGSRAGYTLLAGIFIGLGGVFGYLGAIVEIIPRAVLAPILIFVALDIMVQSFHACPKRHASAVAFAFFPTVARLLQIKLSDPNYVPPAIFQKLISTPGKTLPELLVIVALGNGFILTAMLWGACLAHLIDKQLRRASAYLWVLAGLTFFGVIHSALPEGDMYLPWHLDALARQVPYQFGAAYAILGLMLLAAA